MHSTSCRHTYCESTQHSVIIPGAANHSGMGENSQRAEAGSTVEAQRHVITLGEPRHRDDACSQRPCHEARHIGPIGSVLTR